jgi:hypothetical protein
LIALVGAGGKMGSRILPNLKKFSYHFVCCEKDEAGIAALKAKGYEAMATEDAVQMADITVCALPDAALPGLSKKLVPLLKPGSTVITLDPAAAGRIDRRDNQRLAVPPPGASDQARLHNQVGYDNILHIALVTGKDADATVAVLDHNVADRDITHPALQVAQPYRRRTRDHGAVSDNYPLGYACPVADTGYCDAVVAAVEHAVGNDNIFARGKMDTIVIGNAQVVVDGDAVYLNIRARANR